MSVGPAPSSSTARAGAGRPFALAVGSVPSALACGPTTGRLACLQGVGCAHPRRRFARRPKSKSWPGFARRQEHGRAPESARRWREGAPGGAVPRLRESRLPNLEDDITEQSNPAQGPQREGR